MSNKFLDDPARRLACHLRLAHIPRWCITPTLKTECVASHSHGVAAIALFMLRTGLMTRRDVHAFEVLEYAIGHDEDEALSGDIPNVAKRSGLVAVVKGAVQSGDEMPGGSTLAIVKMCDILHMIHKTREEVAMGNTLAQPLYNDASGLLGKHFEAHGWLGIAMADSWTEWYETDAKVRSRWSMSVLAENLIEDFLSCTRPGGYVHPGMAAMHWKENEV